MTPNQRRQQIPSLRSLLVVWLSLLLLLLLNLGSAALPLGAYNVLLHMAISIIMTLLLMVFFMHLRHELPVVRLAAVIGFVWLGFMIVLSLSDFLIR